MHRRHPCTLPRLWLMTDERMGAALLPSLARLPMGTGVIFRHYGLDQKSRQQLFDQVRRIAAKRRLVLVIAGARLKGGRLRHPGTTWPVHSVPERIAAERAGAGLLLVSPLFSTRSHPGAKTLGRIRFGQIILRARRPVVALGGMDAGRARSLAAMNVHGWAGIDALTMG